VTAEPTQTPEPPSGAWQALADFPPPGTVVASIAAYDSGFVAVGHAQGDRECEGEALDDGRIWTSVDGRSWSPADIDLKRISLTEVLIARGKVYAFGHEGAYGCEPDRQVVVRSDDAVDWRVDEIQLSGEYSYHSDYAAMGDSLLAFGEAYDRDDNFLGSVWTSTNGVDWELRGGSPQTMLSLENSTVSGDSILVFDYSTRPIIVSTDRGETWRHAEFAPLYNAWGSLAAASNGRFAVVGGACCTMPNRSFGYAITSADGVEWTESEQPGFHQVPDGIVGLPDGFVTIGRQSWLSRDGQSWVIGPDLPGYSPNDNYYLPAGASNDDTVVVSNRTRVWVASVGDLDPSAYDAVPRRADRPEVGTTWNYNAFTHCGWPDVHFDMRAWVPEPPLDDEETYNPPQGIRENDHGALTYVSENLLRYTAERGRVIDLVPSHEPTLSGPCA
jgi:hypothetical protein